MGKPVVDSVRFGAGELVRSVPLSLAAAHARASSRVRRVYWKTGRVGVGVARLGGVGVGVGVFVGVGVIVGVGVTVGVLVGTSVAVGSGGVGGAAAALGAPPGLEGVSDPVPVPVPVPPADEAPGRGGK